MKLNGLISSSWLIEPLTEELNCWSWELLDKLPRASYSSWLLGFGWNFVVSLNNPRSLFWMVLLCVSSLGMPKSASEYWVLLFSCNSFLVFEKIANPPKSKVFFGDQLKLPAANLVLMSLALLFCNTAALISLLPRLKFVPLFRLGDLNPPEKL